MSRARELPEELEEAVRQVIARHRGKSRRVLITLNFIPGDGLRGVVDEPDADRADGRRAWRFRAERLTG